MVAHGGSTVYNYCLFFLTSFVRCGALRIRIRPNNMGFIGWTKNSAHLITVWSIF